MILAGPYRRPRVPDPAWGFVRLGFGPVRDGLALLVLFTYAPPLGALVVMRALRRLRRGLEE